MGRHRHGSDGTQYSVCNSWLQCSEDYVFHCDLNAKTGQLETKIVKNSERNEKLGAQYTEVDTIRMLNRRIILTTTTMEPSTPIVHIPKDGMVACLKTHLQKMIRRKNRDKAVKTARNLLCTDPQSLLRRLPVIMVEDVMLLPSLWALVWLMMAYPARGLTLFDEGWLLGLVDKLAGFAWCENLYERAPDPDWLPEISDPLVGCIALRHEYGGMKGDKALFLNTAWTWLQRKKYAAEGDFSSNFALKMLLENPYIVPIDRKSVGMLTNEEFEALALDHHVTPITRLLPPGKNWAQIIWDCSSSRNARVRLDLTMQEAAYWSPREEQLVRGAQERLKERMITLPHSKN